MVERERQRDGSAHGVPGNNGAADASLIHQAADFSGIFLVPVESRFAKPRAVTGKFDSKNLMAGGKILGLALPDRGAIACTMN